MKCGLLGRKLGHSYSPLIHSMLGDYGYGLYESEPEGLGDFLSRTDLTGFNVTIPYKKSVIPYLSQLSPVAEKLSAVNTVVRKPDGTLWGHNTDYFGFHSLIGKSGIRVQGKKVLVLGSGGASSTAVAVLRELGAKVTVISRSGADNYDNLHLHRDAAVIVNTTPVGMYPSAGISPVSLDCFDHLDGVIDVIYNPSKTKLLLDAEARNIPCINGLWMLVAQAKEAAECFTGCRIDDKVIGQIYHALNRKMKNIILVGMPGCGKSTVAQALSAKLGRVCADSDQAIAELTGRTIPEIISNDGEAVFRHYETHVLGNLGQQSGLIISTGGGCVTVPDNLPLLRQNGTIYWLQRDLGKLPTEGRPLSQAASPETLYSRRKGLYAQFADVIIDNNGDLEDAVNAIVTHWEESE